MYKRLYIIAIVPIESRHTLYLFERKSKIIIPVEIDDFKASNLTKRETGVSIEKPSIYNTCWRLINGLGAKMVSVTIYNVRNDYFYAYLNIVFQDKHLEFNTDLGDAINIASRFCSPIYIKNDLLEKCGIKVNSKMLREALAED